MSIDKFSYSKINTYKTCPQRFKINYLDKIYKPHESIEAFMGKRVHEVLEWLHNERENIGSFCTIDHLLDKYNQLWGEKWHQNIYIAKQKYTIVKKKNRKFKSYISLDRNKQIYKDIGEKCLANYYRRYTKNFNKNILGVEMKYSLKIKNITFNCIIDRIDKEENGRYIVYDYKTGKKPISILNASNDLQLSLYHMAIAQNFTDYKEIILKWYFLRQDKIVTIKHSNEKILKLENEILKYIDNIKNDKYYPAKKSILCDWCYFWEECEVMSCKNPAKKL